MSTKKAKRASPRASGSVKSVEKALDILGCFTQERDEISATQLSGMLGYNRTTVHRLLGALEHRGMVSKNPDTRAYSLGLKIRELAALDLWHGELRHKAQPFLRKLRDAMGETAGLYVLTHQQELVCIQKAESFSELRRAARVGSPLPFGLGATSRALLLSFLEKDESALQEVINGLPRANRPPDYQALLGELRQIQERGYCFSQGEMLAGTSAFSTPIRQQGIIIAALTVSGPLSRFSFEAAEKVVPALLDAAQHISKALSHSGRAAPRERAPEKRPAHRVRTKR